MQAHLVRNLDEHRWAGGRLAAGWDDDALGVHVLNLALPVPCITIKASAPQHSDTWHIGHAMDALLMSMVASNQP
jgi:hypothetical protein